MNRSLVIAWFCLILTLCSCQQTGSPLPSPSPDQAATLLTKAQAARQAQDRETEALTLREAVEVLGRQRSPQLEEAQKACVEAMVEAGGNADSYRLWSDMEKKNPTSEEAPKMKERARNLMLGQAGELSAQVEIDRKAGKPQAALCTAIAALSLLQQAGADPARVKAAAAIVQRAKGALPKPSKPTEIP